MLGIAIAQAAQTEPTATGVGALGIDLGAFIFQVINFAILLIVLRIFAYPLIVKVLEARRQKIEAALKTAAELDKAKAAAAKKEQAILTAARTQAEQIIIQAKHQAQTIANAIETKAQEHAEQIKHQAQVEINQSLAAAHRELKEEAVQLVIAATEQIIKVKLDPLQDEKLITEALEVASKTVKKPT
jgi:F-type H+-transporting ATPase subunit b